MRVCNGVGVAEPYWIDRAEAERDPRAHELALLEATRRALAAEPYSGLLHMSGDSLVSVELVGDYPDTKVRITIQYSHHRGSKVRGYDFGIWGPEGRHNGMRDLTITPSPAFFAANVAGWAVEE